MVALCPATLETVMRFRRVASLSAQVALPLLMNSREMVRRVPSALTITPLGGAKGLKLMLMVP